MSWRGCEYGTHGISVGSSVTPDTKTARSLYCSVEVSHNKMHRWFPTGPQMTTKRGTVEQQQATHQRSLGVREMSRRVPKR